MNQSCCKACCLKTLLISYLVSYLEILNKALSFVFVILARRQAIPSGNEGGCRFSFCP